jgi:hypothetical protein
MSTWSQEAVPCPGCGAAVAAAIVRGVAGGRAAGLRAAALDGSLHRPRCPRCDVVIAIEEPFLYTDLGRGEWVMVAPTPAWTAWRDAEALALATFARATAAAPRLAAAAAGCRVRLVFGVDELREKLTIWDAGGDDARYECAKLAVLRREPGLRRPGERLRWDQVATDPLVLVAVRPGAPTPVRGGWDVPRRVIAELDLDAWRPAFPELFGRGFVSIDRWLTAEPA